MPLPSGSAHPSRRPRLSARPARLLAAVVVALAAGTTGCSVVGTGPRAAAKAPEPYVLLKLSERRVYLKDDPAGAVPPEGFPVAIGKPRYPTPTGRFAINELVRDPDFLAFDFNNPHKKDRGRIAPGISNPLGLRWIGFTQEYGWAIGFHGTAKTAVLGQAVSHGCVRMANPDIVRLFDRLKLGTPVVVEQ